VAGRFEPADTCRADSFNSDAQQHAVAVQLAERDGRRWEEMG
jgi:hypothetical protein